MASSTECLGILIIGKGDGILVGIEAQPTRFLGNSGLVIGELFLGIHVLLISGLVAVEVVALDIVAVGCVSVHAGFVWCKRISQAIIIPESVLANEATAIAITTGHVDV